MLRTNNTERKGQGFLEKNRRLFASVALGIVIGGSGVMTIDTLSGTHSPNHDVVMATVKLKDFATNYSVAGEIQKDVGYDGGVVAVENEIGAAEAQQDPRDIVDKPNEKFTLEIPDPKGVQYKPQNGPWAEIRYSPPKV